MAVSNTNIELRKDNIVANVPVDCDIPVFSDSEIYIYYGNARTPAIVGTDYHIILANAGAGYEATWPTLFSFVPTASLIAKIDAAILADPSEENFVAVRRTLDLTTDFTQTDGFLRAKIANEFDRTIMRFQQLSHDVDVVQATQAAFASDVAQVAADRVQTGADRVQTGADRVQTGADRVQTGLDVIQASTVLASSIRTDIAQAFDATQKTQAIDNLGLLQRANTWSGSDYHMGHPSFDVDGGPLGTNDGLLRNPWLIVPSKAQSVRFSTTQSHSIPEAQSQHLSIVDKGSVRFTASIVDSVMDVTAISNGGELGKLMTVFKTSDNTSPGIIISLGTGTGGLGTYNISPAGVNLPSQTFAAAIYKIGDFTGLRITGADAGGGYTTNSVLDVDTDVPYHISPCADEVDVNIRNFDYSDAAGPIFQPYLPCRATVVGGGKRASAMHLYQPTGVGSNRGLIFNSGNIRLNTIEDYTTHSVGGFVKAWGTYATDALDFSQATIASGYHVLYLPNAKGIKSLNGAGDAALNLIQLSAGNIVLLGGGTTPISLRGTTSVLTNAQYDGYRLYKSDGVTLVGSLTGLDADNDSGDFTLRVGGAIKVRISASAALDSYINTGKRFGIKTSAPSYDHHVNGTFGFNPGASVTPANNGDVTVELTSNTLLTFKAKGSDGVVRSGTLTLA